MPVSLAGIRTVRFISIKDLGLNKQELDDFLDDMNDYFDGQDSRPACLNKATLLGILSDQSENATSAHNKDHVDTVINDIKANLPDDVLTEIERYTIPSQNFPLSYVSIPNMFHSSIAP